MIVSRVRVLSLAMALFLSAHGVGIADVIFASSQNSNAIYRYQLSPTGSPVLDATLTANLALPEQMAMSSTGELFVSNAVAGPVGSGLVARFTDAVGQATPNGIIPNSQSNPGFSFSRPFGAGFRGNELFISNFDAKVLRFTFDGAGQAVSSGIITDHLSGSGVRGLAISPSGDLFVATGIGTNGDAGFVQWTFDSAGNAQFVRQFSTGIGSAPHSLAFSPWGELFVDEPTTNSVLRFKFDSSGNPVSNGSITGNGLNVPIGIAFSSWGELFVSNNGANRISRFTFDSQFRAVSNGTIVTPGGTVNGLVITSVPEPSSLILTAAGIAATIPILMRRRRRSA